jgi:hypothetical protein
MSVNINHQTNNVQVGSALTLGHTQGLQYHTQSLHTDGFEVNNINASGIVTAGIVTANTIEVSGISTFRNEIEIYRPNNSIYSYTFLDFIAGTGAADRVGGISIYNDTLTLGAQDCDLRLSGDQNYDTVITTSGVNGSYTGSTGRTAVFTSDGTAQLWYQDVKKFETTGSGVKVTGIATATGFSTSGGTSSQFLKADGSVDSSTYLTYESQNLNDVLQFGNVTNYSLSVGVISATSFVRHSGTSSQFLKADGSVDSSTYLTSETQTLNDVLGLGNTSSTGLSVGVVTATSFVKSGGTSSQYLMADGSVTTSGGGGGGASEAFKTISVSGQSDVVADSATDTLTLVAGSNMTITTNASGDSVTFASSGGGGGGGVSQEESIAFAIALG